MDDAELVSRVTAIVGTAQVVAGESARAAAAVDGAVPRVIVKPLRIDDVSRVVMLAHDAGLAVLPRGGGTGLALGQPPRRADIVLDTSELNGIVAYEPADLTLTVQAGIRLGDLARVLEKHHQLLPLDPPGWRQRSLGGVLATNASGSLRTRHGTARDLLLGVRFVQADGTITAGGSRVVKSVTGYDIPKLMVGALGSLGIIVEATVRVYPMPEVERVWLASFEREDTADHFLRTVLDSALEPRRLDVLNAAVLDGVKGRGAVGVLIAFGGGEEAADAQGAALSDMAAAAGAACFRLSLDGDEWSSGWTKDAAATMALRIACLVTEVVPTLRALDRVAADVGATVRAWGAAGAGALHAEFRGDVPAATWRDRVLEPLRARAARDGGSVVIERCPRALKEIVDVWGVADGPELSLMRRLKHEFDPTGVLNPGRFVGGL